MLKIKRDIARAKWDRTYREFFGRTSSRGGSGRLDMQRDRPDRFRWLAAGEQPPSNGQSSDVCCRHAGRSNQTEVRSSWKESNGRR